MAARRPTAANIDPKSFLKAATPAAPEKPTPSKKVPDQASIPRGRILDPRSAVNTSEVAQNPQ